MAAIEAMLTICAPRGLRFTRLGHRVYSEKIVEQVDPRGRTHYWLGAGPPEWEALEGTDMGAVHEGFVSVTPVHLDLTNHRGLALMADWSSALDAQWRRLPGVAAQAARSTPSTRADRSASKVTRRRRKRGR